MFVSIDLLRKLEEVISEGFNLLPEFQGALGFLEKIIREA